MIGAQSVGVSIVAPARAGRTSVGPLFPSTGQRSPESVDGRNTTGDPIRPSSETGTVRALSSGNLLNIMDRVAGAESLPADVIYIGVYPDGVRQSAFSGWSVGRWIIQ